MKEFADENFEFDKNENNSSKILWEGEIACNSLLRAISLFPQCFQKTCTADTKNPGLIWEWVKSLTEKLILKCNKHRKIVLSGNFKLGYEIYISTSNLHLEQIILSSSQRFLLFQYFTKHSRVKMTLQYKVF